MKIDADYLNQLSALVIECAELPYNDYFSMYENQNDLVKEHFVNNKKLISRVTVLELENDEQGREFLNIAISLFDDSNNYESAKFTSGFLYYKDIGINDIHISIK